MASQVERLREEITGIITLTRSNQPPPQPTSPTAAEVDSKLHQTIRAIDARKAASSEMESLLATVTPETSEITTTEALVSPTAVQATLLPSPPPLPCSPSAVPRDRVVLVLKSGGGTVTGYGLAAAQLSRIKAAGLGQPPFSENCHPILISIYHLYCNIQI